MVWHYLLWSLGTISAHLEWSLLSCFQYSFGEKKKEGLHSCISFKESKSLLRVSGAISELMYYLPGKLPAVTAKMGLSIEGMNYKYSVILYVFPDWHGRRFINPVCTFITMHKLSLIHQSVQRIIFSKKKKYRVLSLTHSLTLLGSLPGKMSDFSFLVHLILFVFHYQKNL